jgi:hypothetical protein
MSRYIPVVLIPCLAESRLHKLSISKSACIPKTTCILKPTSLAETCPSKVSPYSPVHRLTMKINWFRSPRPVKPISLIRRTVLLELIRQVSSLKLLWLQLHIEWIRYGLTHRVHRFWKVHRFRYRLLQKCHYLCRYRLAIVIKFLFRAFTLNWYDLRFAHDV